MVNKVKNLQLITRMIVGGAQETAMLVADLLDRNRYVVDLLTGVQIGTEGSLLDETRRRGISLILKSSLVREINPIKDCLGFLQLYHHIRNNRYQLVHTHSSKAGILGRWAAWLAGTPLIVHTVHGWGHHDRQSPLVRQFYILLEKLTLPITDKLITVSPRDIEKGLQVGIGKPDDYTVIRSGVELDRFGHPQKPPEQMRQSLNIPLDVPLVGTVARLSPQKAPLDFIQTCATIAQQNSDVWFVLVGDGPLRPDVEAKVVELGLADRLVLTGLRRDVPELMAMFDIFVLTSLWEGLPRVLPQAMATGLPIVATAVDGTAEAVIHGENGYLVPPNQPDELANYVLRLLCNSELAQQMGQAGRTQAVQFGACKMVHDIDILYRQLLKKKQLRLISSNEE